MIKALVRVPVLMIIASIGLGWLANGFCQEAVEQAEKAFKLANNLMEQTKYGEALEQYQKVLVVYPNNASVLYNAGFAAYNFKDYSHAIEMWKKLKSIDPADWQVRAKLIQAYQAISNLPERDVERAGLIDMWKSGSNADLKEQVEYCRDRFEVGDKIVMGWEHFRLEGNRAIRYQFDIAGKDKTDEEFRISLGSYEQDNLIWRERTNPKPKDGDRLFHLDGYFKNGHATYGMFSQEPSYDEVRHMVIDILEGKLKPVASSTINPAKSETNPKP